MTRATAHSRPVTAGTCGRAGFPKMARRIAGSTRNEMRIQ
jgi:hypothetical protein